MPSRRAYLSAVAAAAGLAGCGERTGTPTDSRDDTARPTDSPTRSSTGSSTATERPPPDRLSGGWTHDRADARRTGQVPVPVPEPDRVVWSVALDRPAGVRVVDGRVFVGRPVRRLTAGGATAWTVGDHETRVGPVADGRLYLHDDTAGAGPLLRALPLTDGSGTPTGGWERRDSRPCAVDDDLLVASRDSTGHLDGIAPTDGTVRWTFDADATDLPADEVGHVALGVERVFLTLRYGSFDESDTDFEDQWLCALDRSTGERLWTTKALHRGGDLAVLDAGVAVGGGRSQVGLWGRDGTERWRADVSDASGRTGRVAPVVAGPDGGLVAGTGASSVAFADDGSRRWTATGRVRAAGDGTALLAAGTDLRAVDATGERRWTMATGPARTVVPLRADGEPALLALTNPDAGQPTLELFA